MLVINLFFTERWKKLLLISLQILISSLQLNSLKAIRKELHHCDNSKTANIEYPNKINKCIDFI